MSIILEGIDLPNNGQIELIIRPHGKVFSNTRGIYAEAIQIPKGHGRLIDGCILFKEYQNLCNGILCRDCPFFTERNSCSLEEWILDAPTIIQAEE